VHLYEKYSAGRYLRWQQVSNFVKVVQKSLGMNKFVRTKVTEGVTRSKIPKCFFDQLYTEWIVVVHLYSGFLCGVRWRHNRAPSLERRFWVNFVPVWGTIASPSIIFFQDHVFEVCYKTRCILQRTEHFADTCVGGATRFGKLRSKFCKA